MSKDSSGGGAKGGGAQSADVRRAVLFELEYVGLGARAAFCDAVKAACGEVGVVVSRTMFCKFGLDGTPRMVVASLLRASGKSGEVAGSLGVKAVELFAAGLTRRGELAGPVQKLLAQAAKRGVAVGAVSILGADELEPVADALGLEAGGIAVATPEGDEGRAYPTPAAWGRAGKALGVPPSRCVAVAAAGEACRAALACGVRTFALPDAFTGFQDFGGCERTLDALDDAAVAEILGLVETF